MKTILSLLIALFFTFNTTGVKAQDSIVKAVHDSPSVYFGLARAGEKCSKKSKKLTIRYAVDSELTDYQILSFRMSVNGVSSVYHATGSMLSEEMLRVLKQLKTSDEINFILRVNGSDGITRSISCSYFIEDFNTNN